jgi:hypothetical protein
MKTQLQNFFIWHNETIRQYDETNKMLLKYISYYENLKFKPNKTIICEYCKKSFVQKRKIDHQKFCSMFCREKSYYLKYKTKKIK